VRPLNNLLKQDAPFKWKEEHTQAMDKLAQVVAANPILQRPNYDQPFFLEVNASQFATGAILSQKDVTISLVCSKLMIFHAVLSVAYVYDIFS
jgi:hypothetical protein